MEKAYKNISVLWLENGQFVNSQALPVKTVRAHRALFDDNREYARVHEHVEDTIREATTYANFAQAQEFYINRARATGTTAYQIAITDWLGAPEVLEINVDDWSGESGQTIRVKAKDNVRVARVSVVIRDADENILEMGEAVQSEPGSAWWDYTTQSFVTTEPFPMVEAIAQDLPGNIDSFVIS
jgi:hypothetical protein